MRRSRCPGQLAMVSAALMLFSGIPPCIANNMRVENTVVMQAGAGKAKVKFDIAWDNSWLFRHINHDAAWVFFKVLVKGSEGQGWKHVTLSGSGANPEGYSTGTGGKDFEIVVPEDGMGLFFQRSASNAGAGNISVSNVVVVWDLAKSGISSGMEVRMQALALEMCYVPEGAFWVGVPGATEANKLHMVRGDLNPVYPRSDSSRPFRITNENALAISDTDGNLYAADAIVEGTLSKEFPKGYAAFYCMKYEITQGQYADFLNALTPPQAATREYIGEVARHTITESNGVYAAGAPDRACNCISWMDGAAFADWAGLRPMTDLEFEKACRGPLYPVRSEFAWGSTNIVQQTAVDTTDGPDGSGRERALSEKGGPANCNCSSKMKGPVRVGMYATNGTDMVSAGASYWGIMELSGNLRERVVTIGDFRGRHFAGTHGDGALSAAGNATNPDWPGLAAATGEVTGRSGAGVRGGRWPEDKSSARVSDRRSDLYVDAVLNVSDGWRGARTAPSRVGP